MKILTVFANLCAYALVIYGTCIWFIVLIGIYLRLFPNANTILVVLLALLTLLLVGLCVGWYIVSKEKESEDEKETN